MSPCRRRRIPAPRVSITSTTPWAVAWRRSIPVRTPGSGWENFLTLYDGVTPIEERYITDNDPNGQTKRRFYYEEGINKLAPVEIYNYDGNHQFTGISSYIPLTDDRGTVMGVVQEGVGLVEKLYYNSTGLCKSFDGSDQPNLDPTGFNIGRSLYIPFGWCGMYRDEFTGKYHTHFRDYCPIHGRWLSEEPAGYMDGLSLYNAYMGVNSIDPLGLGKIAEKMRRMGSHEELLHQTVKEITEEMEKEGWQPPKPIPGKLENPGAFGVEVERRTIERLKKKQPDKWQSNVWIDNKTKEVVSVGKNPVTNATEIDVLCLKHKQKPFKVGDKFDIKKVKLGADIKTGDLLYGDQKVRLKSLLGKRLRQSTPPKKWTRSKGWHQNPKYKKVMLVLTVYAGANALYAMAHADEYNHLLDEIYEKKRLLNKAMKSPIIADRVLAKVELEQAVTNYMRNFVLDDTVLDAIDGMAVYSALRSEAK
jgi:RHS repeat-associated protein